MPRSENTVTDLLSGGGPERDDLRAATQEADYTNKEKIKDVIGPSSLRSRALTSLTEAFVHDQEFDLDALSQAQMLSGFWPAVKVALYKNADSLKSTPKTLEMMYQSLKQERHVDAGPFSTISIPDLAIVLDRLSHSGQMRSLNLSGRSKLTKNELEVLIKHTRALQTLYLMGAPSSISMNDLTELQLPGDVYHPLLFERAHRAVRWKTPETGLPILDFPPREHSLRHIAHVAIPVRDRATGESNLPSSGIEWCNLIARSSNPGLKHRYLLKRLDEKMQCRKYFLMETPMSLIRLVVGIRNLFQW